MTKVQKRKIFIEKDTDTVNAAVRAYLKDHPNATMTDFKIKKDCDAKVGTLDYEEDE